MCHWACCSAGPTCPMRNDLASPTSPFLFLMSVGIYSESISINKQALRYPYLKLKSDEFVLLDDNGGGHISPRNFVAAQKKVARLQGCHIIEDVVCGTQTLSDGIHVVFAFFSFFL
ncbi:hypothetical protein AVEN_131414-1 [Araneus ventricosus]|uniref:Uncharacterized protein n=1 Tax=Araneus ventricosus TaxID=182803 RepID=A0A4Y2NBF4_ARAVE|nr:hypothetical protein AVEN_131414-1 [Araneus ventricosus]